MLIEQIKDVVVHTIMAHPEVGLLVTYIICLLETLVLIGMVVPGTLFMTAIGILAGSHIMPLGLTIVAATLGAVTGDIISYGFGRRYQDGIRNLWPFYKWPQLFIKGERFFQRHGRKSLFLGRFIGPLRPILPMMLGMTNMSFRKFIVADVASAAIWAPCYMLPGILVGAASRQLAAKDATRVVLIILLSLLFLWIFSHLLLKIFRKFVSLSKRRSYQLWHYLSDKTWFKQCYLFLRATQKRGHHRQMNRLLLFIISSIGLLCCIYSVKQHGVITAYNQAVFHLLQSIRNPWLDHLAYAMTLMGQKQIIIPCLFIIVAWFTRLRYWRHALHYAVLSLLAIAGIVALKHFVHFIRPLPSVPGFSFPSGHTTLSLIYFGMMAIFITHKMHKRRWQIILLASLCYLLTALSRLYLGAHWLSDIIGSSLLGVSCLMLISLSWHRYPAPRIKRWRFFGLSIIPFLLIAVGYYSLHYQQFKTMYRRYFPVNMISIKQWQQQNLQFMPSLRKNRLGKPTELLNLQWLGKLSHIHQQLQQFGWQDAPKNNITQTLTRLAAKRGQHQLPLFPPTFFDRAPLLVMVKKPQQSEKPPVVIRLWLSPIQIKHTKQALWIGTITYQHRAHGIQLPSKKLKPFAIYPDASHELTHYLSKNQWQHITPPAHAKQISYQYHPQQYRQIILINNK